MKQILFLSQVLPYPLDAGPKLRAYYVLRYLAQRYEVTLLSFQRPSDPPEALEHLKTICARIVTAPMVRSTLKDIWALGRSLLTRQPFLIIRDQETQMDDCLQQLLRRQDFDFIHADQLWMASYALRAGNLLKKKGERPVLVLDQHNAVFQIPRRMAANTHNPLLRQLLLREERLIARYEAKVCQQFDRVAWVTGQDIAALSQVDPAATRNASVIPICVDPDQVEPVLPLTQEPTILFVGGMHWPPNTEGVRWFVQEVLPRIQQEIPAVKLNVVGKSPPHEIKGIDGIVAPGYVEDAGLYWKESRVFVVPLSSGGGMRVKILDAWARQIPIVSTAIGAEGINYQDGENILIADQPQAMAKHIVDVLRNDSLASSLANAGRAAVIQRYDWHKIYPAWDALYEYSE